MSSNLVASPEPGGKMPRTRNLNVGIPTQKSVMLNLPADFEMIEPATREKLQVNSVLVSNII